MKVDLNQYAINKSFIQELYKKNGGSVRDIVIPMAATIHCSLICLTFYVAEQEGFTPEIKEMIDSYIKFYGYTNIIGQPANSPYLHLTKPYINDIK